MRDFQNHSDHTHSDYELKSNLYLYIKIFVCMSLVTCILAGLAVALEGSTEQDESTPTNNEVSLPLSTEIMVAATSIMHTLGAIAAAFNLMGRNPALPANQIHDHIQCRVPPCGTEQQINLYSSMPTSPETRMLTSHLWVFIWTGQSTAKNGSQCVYMRFRKNNQWVGSEFLAAAVPPDQTDNYLTQKLSHPALTEMLEGFIMTFQAHQKNMPSPVNAAYYQLYNLQSGSQVGVMQTVPTAEWNENNVVEVQPTAFTLLDKYPLIQKSTRNRTGNLDSYVEFGRVAKNKPGYENLFRISTNNTYFNLAGLSQAFSNSVTLIPSSNRCVSVWHTLNSTTGGNTYESSDVYAQMFYGVNNPESEDVIGPIGNNFKINEISSGNPCTPHADGASNASFMVVWVHYQKDTDEYCIKGRLFDRLRKPITSEITVNTPASINISSVRVAWNKLTKEFIVVWSGYHPDDEKRGIVSQFFNVQGNLTRANNDVSRNYGFLVNTYTTHSQVEPWIEVLPNDSGDFVVTWRSSAPTNVTQSTHQMIISQRFNKNNEKIPFNGANSDKEDENNSSSSFPEGAKIGISIGAAVCVIGGLGLFGYCRRKDTEYYSSIEEAEEKNIPMSTQNR